jgi:hypothetical protein
LSTETQPDLPGTAKSAREFPLELRLVPQLRAPPTGHTAAADIENPATLVAPRTEPPQAAAAEAARRRRQVNLAEARRSEAQLDRVAERDHAQRTPVQFVPRPLAVAGIEESTAAEPSNV